MPVNKSTTLIYQVESATVSADGSVSVIVSVTNNGDRMQSIQASFDPATCAPLWAAVPPAGKARWPDLRDQLYALLQAQGYIPA